MITEEQFAPDIFQHCSTIISDDKKGTFIAYYTGKAEMHASQHVRIHWRSPKGEEVEPIDLEDYTGNPILFWSNKGPRIIYSKFEKLVPRRVEWWQHCSLWSRAITIKKGLKGSEITVGKEEKISFIEDSEMEDPSLGYLARCHPIKDENGYLLPLYKEHRPDYYGVLLESKDGVKWKYKCSFGKEEDCIQPAIFKHNDKYHALFRNFSRVMGSRPMAYYSSSDDATTWSPLVKSPYLNANNSLASVFVGDTPLIIWNDDIEGRRNITLGTFSNNPKKIIKFDNYGSYPSACVDSKFLHVTYTAIPNHFRFQNVKSVIKHKVYDLNAISDIILKHNL